MDNRFEIVVGAGTLMSAAGSAVRFPHRWTSAGVTPSPPARPGADGLTTWTARQRQTQHPTSAERTQHEPSPPSTQVGADAIIGAMQPPSEADGPGLASDEDIQRVRLDKVTPHNAPITLADYDPGWPVLYAREAARIRAALGARAVQVEHAGSTSVPGLAAKPIIDILLAVPDSSDEHAYVPALERAGYVLRAREPDWFEHRMFKGPDTDVNLHVFTAGAAEIDRMLLFRDWLRVNDADRDAYLRVKRDLAQQTWRHVQHYADAKSAIVEQIIARATLHRRSGPDPAS